MNTLIRHIFVVCLVFASLPGHAADFPTKPVRIITAAAGGAQDIVSRALGREMERIFKQPVVVENKPGAGGQLASDSVARAAPDGHTLTIGSGLSLSPVFIKNPLVLSKDLAPVSLIANNPFIMVIPNNLPAKTLPEFFAYAKANPGKLNYASNGPGIVTGLYFAAMISREKLKMQDIPYTGGGINEALIRGDVQTSLLGSGNAKAYLGTGKGIAVAVTGRTRLKAFPDVPTFYELGIPNIDSSVVAIYAPAGTPPDLVAKVNAVVVEAGKAPDFVKRLDALNFTVVLSSPEELRQSDDARTKWGLELARAMNIHPK